MAWPDTLGKSLAEHETLKLKCIDCGHEVRWSRGRAIAIFGEHVTPRDIRKAVICKGCNSRKVEVWI